MFVLVIIGIYTDCYSASKKLLILGLGLVGNSLLSLVLHERLFRMDNILAVDASEDAFGLFDELHGNPENRIFLHVDRSNYRTVFDRLVPGDVLAVLADGLESNALLRECLRRGIHFISSSDDSFADDPTPEYACPEQIHYDANRTLQADYRAAPTSILQFGCNPGLISVLSKKALRDIVLEDQGAYVSENRAALLELLDRGDYLGIAAKLQIRAMIETDLDTTDTSITEAPHTLYSTWNTRDFETEMNRRALLRVGTLDTPESILRRFRVCGDPVSVGGKCGSVNQAPVHSFHPADRTLILSHPGKHVRAEGFGPNGSFEGCVIPHEEIVSLYDYYSMRDSEGRLIYAPTVYFLYRPCPLAMRSLFHAQNNRRELITKDRMSSGGEVVGILLEGNRFRSRYVYTELTVDSLSAEFGKASIPDVRSTPTVLQVSVSLLAAIRYVLQHPEEGILYPEDTPLGEMLSYAAWYLPVASRKV